MSWDVILMKVPPDITSMQEFGEDLQPLGSRNEVLAVLAQALPSANFSDPTWGIFDGPDFSIEFNMGVDDAIKNTIMLHVRGSDKVIDVIHHICNYAGWRAFDTATDRFINFSQEPAVGLQQWRMYRDQLTASFEAQGQKVEKDVRLVISSKKKKRWQFWK